MRTFFFLFVVSCLSLTTLSAQKYGHMNFANVLSEMDGATRADERMKAVNDSLVNVGEAMAAELQEEARVLEQAQSTLPPVEFNKRRDALLAKRDDIGKFEQSMARQLEMERQKLLGPLISAVKEAVRVVAEREGYQLVFDTSIFNAVLFAEDSVDLAELVKAELAKNP